MLSIVGIKWVFLSNWYLDYEGDKVVGEVCTELSYRFNGSLK